jgi:hypothetical protein
MAPRCNALGPLPLVSTAIQPFHTQYPVDPRGWEPTQPTAPIPRRQKTGQGGLQASPLTLASSAESPTQHALPWPCSGLDVTLELGSSFSPQRRGRCEGRCINGSCNQIRPSRLSGGLAAARLPSNGTLLAILRGVGSTSASSAFGCSHGWAQTRTATADKQAKTRSYRLPFPREIK